METKKILASTAAGGALFIGGFFLADTGFSKMTEVGHIEACQNPQEAIKSSCGDVRPAAPLVLDNQYNVAGAEAWGGVLVIALGAAGLAVTGTKAVGNL